MLRTLLVTGLFVTSTSFGTAADLPVARLVSIPAAKETLTDLTKAITSQTGTAIDVTALDGTKEIPAAFEKLEFWKALDLIAERSESHVVVTANKIAFKRGKATNTSYIAGPFRFTIREILIRSDLLSGTNTYDIILEAAWEPWLNSYRIDSAPTIEKLFDDTGKTFDTAAPSSRTFTSGHSALLTVRPRGLNRASKSLTIQGSIQITIADELLTFTLDSQTPTPPQQGIEVSLKKSGVDGPDWFADVEVRYPKSNVIWESHEDYWLRANRLRLLPGRGEPIVAAFDNIDMPLLRYSLKNGVKTVQKNWKFEYRTPGPMREIVIPFNLKDIPLP